MTEQTELEKEFLDSINDMKQVHADWTEKWFDRPEDLDKLVKSDDYQVRCYVANIGRDKDLDQLVNDEDDLVRANVVDMGRKQDILVLIGDPSEYVQEALRTQIEWNFEDLDYLQKKVKILEEK